MSSCASLLDQKPGGSNRNLQCTRTIPCASLLHQKSVPSNRQNLDKKVDRHQGAVVVICFVAGMVGLQDGSRYAMDLDCLYLAQAAGWGVLQVAAGLTPEMCVASLFGEQWISS